MFGFKNQGEFMLKHFFVFLWISTFFLYSFASASQEKAAKSNGSHKYLVNRLSKTDKRYASFSLILELLEHRKAKTLIETGTARLGDCFWGDGGSTIIFGDWASQNQAILSSVDINPNAINTAQNFTQAYSQNICFFCQDSIDFLANFEEPIDFLYLDSYDFDFNNPHPSQNHHLLEIQAAYPRLHRNSIVMVDDCDLPHGGKGALIIQFLMEKGWIIVFKGYQVILVR